MNRKTLLAAILLAALSLATLAQEPQAAPKPQPANTLIAQPVESTTAYAEQPANESLDNTTVNVAPGIPLQKAIADIAQAAAVNIAIDWAALETAGIARNSTAALTLNKVSARLALRSLLAQFSNGNISFVVDHNQVTISTTDELRKRFQAVRVYDIGFFLADYEPGTDVEQDAENQLADTLRAAVAPDSWRDAGGAVGSLRILSGKLIVNQSYDVFPELDAIIDLLHKSPAKTTAAYDVRDLLKDAPPPDALGHGIIEDLVNTIETTCGRDTWRDRGGKTSSIAPFEGKLFITTTPAIHQQIESLLALMRKKD